MSPCLETVFAAILPRPMMILSCRQFARNGQYCASTLRRSKFASLIRRCGLGAMRFVQQPKSSNGPSGHPQLFAKPRVRRFRRESWMPCHEIRKAFDLVRGLHYTHLCSHCGDLPQSAGYGEDQVGAGDSEDCRYKERDTEQSIRFNPSSARGLSTGVC